jgi:transposase InsO family protein
VIGLAQSSYYYESVEKEEEELVQFIEELSGKHPTYGSRRITAMLRRGPYEMVVNRKRVQRIMREKELECPKRKACKKTTNSRHQFARYENLVLNLVVERPDHVWVCDITYVRLGNSEFVYLAIVMDVFTRSIRGWSLSRSLAMEVPLAALRQGLSKGVPQIHHSDQGVQYACTGYTEELQSKNVKISMADVGKAEQNGYAERVIRTIKEEEVYLNEYNSFEDAFEQIGSFIEDVYNKKRIHSSLGYLTPSEFEQQWQKQQAASHKKSTQRSLQL